MGVSVRVSVNIGVRIMVSHGSDSVSDSGQGYGFGSGTVRVKVRVGIGCDVMTYLAPVFLLCLFRRSFFPSSPVPFSLSSWHFLMLPSKGVLLP